MRLAGRVSAGLAEAVRICLAEREDLEHTREAVAQLAHAQGALGLIPADQVAALEIEGKPWIRVPRALLHRCPLLGERRRAGWWPAWPATARILLRPQAFPTRSTVTPSCCGHSPRLVAD